MAVIVKNIESNQIISFVKGADTSIIPRIKEKCHQGLDKISVEKMNNLSNEGLRTLMFANKIITQQSVGSSVDL